MKVDCRDSIGQPHMSYSLNSFKRVIQGIIPGTTIRVL